MGNVTRWSSKLAMVKRFNEIHDELIDAPDYPHSSYSMNASEQLASKTRRYYAMLSEIDRMTKSIQQRVRTLADSRGDIDKLILAVREERENRQCTDAEWEPSTYHFLQVLRILQCISQPFAKFKMD